MMNSIVHCCTGVYSALIEAFGISILPLIAAAKAAPRWNIKERCGLPFAREAVNGRTVAWIHAASMGESKVLMKFLDILKKKHPGDAYVLTATTRSGVEYLSTQPTDNVVAVGFLPLDTLRLMRSMIDSFRVTRVWLMETELWPSMMMACIRAGVPVGIVNARMEERSFNSYRRFRALCTPIFRSLDIVLAQNEPYARRFALMGTRPDKVHIIGNLKSLVDIGVPPPQQRQALRGAMHLGNGDFVLTAGCVHAGEGIVLKDALAILREGGMHVKCIVVPRHLGDTPALINEFGGAALHVKEARAPREWDVCIIEKMGVLTDMYKAADAAFIGGTFVPVGGHNVWDAAQFALPVFFGPHHHAQRESCEQIIQAGAGFSVTGARDLARRISSLFISGAAQSSTLADFIQASRTRFKEIEHLLP